MNRWTRSRKESKAAKGIDERSKKEELGRD
jgi:hypothetical protein